MTASEWLAAVAAVALVASCMVAGVALVSLATTLRRLREHLTTTSAETTAALGELREAVRRARAETERVEALLTTAEAVGERLDTASRLAYRTVSNPVVKAVAIGTGTRRAVQRLRRADDSSGR